MDTLATLYLCVAGYAWGGTKLVFWQALLWPYYAVNGLW
jgi:hypothetical protein